MESYEKRNGKIDSLGLCADAGTKEREKRKIDYFGQGKNDFVRPRTKIINYSWRLTNALQRVSGGGREDGDFVEDTPLGVDDGGFLDM